MTVLHVDDDPDFVEMAKLFLERIQDDLTVVTAYSAIDALDRLEEESIDAIISDYQMPRMDGIDLLRSVREEYPDLPFILCTARGSEEVATEAIAADVTDYIQKGTDTDQWEVLANRVSNAVDRYRTSRQLWETLGLSKHLMEQGLAGVYLIQDGRFIFANEYVADLFSFHPDELIGEPVTAVSIDGPAPSAGGDSCLDAIPAGAESARYRSHVRTDGGDRLPVELEVAEIDVNGAPAVAGVIVRRDQTASHCGKGSQ
ncbi:MAG: response regulator [Halobacteriota archaeon]